MEAVFQGWGGGGGGLGGGFLGQEVREGHGVEGHLHVYGELGRGAGELWAVGAG